MKPGLSSLNPYAASYIPLAKREACDRTELTAKDSKRGNENVWNAHVVQNQHHGQVSHDFVAHSAQKILIPEGSALKSCVHRSSGSSPPMTYEDFEMDLEYLQMSFPGLSDQSLTDVYLANNHDLEATVDMLTQLEFDTVYSSQSLPETLDIGDVSESGSSSEGAAVKLYSVVGEAASSSSASPGSAAVS